MFTPIGDCIHIVSNHRSVIHSRVHVYTYSRALGTGRKMHGHARLYVYVHTTLLPASSRMQ